VRCGPIQHARAENGNQLSPTDLQQLAAEENKSDDE
jgi:hypothetical protein